MDAIIDLCISPDDNTSGEEERMKWKGCIAAYRNAMQLLRKKTDLSNDEVKLFQQHVDAFFVTWVSLESHEGVTNYIHTLGAGHIGEYLLHHRNLYKHSQQGWEAYNSLLKTFFFRRTGRGGAGNRGTSIKSKIILIARWLSRRVLWLLGYSYDTISEELLHVVPENDFDDDNNGYESSTDNASTSSDNDDTFEDSDDNNTI